MQLSFRCENQSFLKHIFYLTTIGTCVHHHSTSQRSRNPGSKLKTGQSVCQRLFGDYRQHRSCLCAYLFSPHLNIIQISVNLYHHAPVPLISHQKITSVAKDIKWHLIRPAKTHGLSQCLRTLRHHKNVGRAADTEGRMAAHRLILIYLTGSCNLTQPGI